MKKITSIFSLGLLLSTSLLLGSCGDCESGPGCDGSGASSATVEELKQKVNEQANQIAALSSEVEAVPYTIYQDADGRIWLGNINDPSQKHEITAGLKGPKGDPGTPGTTVSISDDHFWVINGTKTNVKAEGQVGTTPTITISDDGYWTINGEKTSQKAQGASGTNGKTPKMRVNATNNHWEVSYDEGATWTDTGVNATGAQGAAGKTPQVRVNATNNHWEVSYDDGTTWTDTGVNATGAQGPAGADGKSGAYDSANNSVYVTYKDGTGAEKTIYIPEVSQDDNNVYIKVGGASYTLPKNGGGSGCTCTWALTNNNNGTYTLTNGKTGAEESTVTIPVWDNVKWIKDVKVVANADGTFTISKADGSQPVTIPTGSADVTVKDGVATVTSKNGQTTIKLQELQPVVSTEGGYVKIVNYNFSGEKVDSVYLPTKGQLADLTNTVGQISNKLDSVAQAGQVMSNTLDSLSNAVTQLEKKVTDKMNELFKNVFNSIAKSITNIQVEEVMSNAIGSYNGVLTNLKTTKLVGYFGTTDEIAFPSHNPLFFKDAGDPAMTETIGDIQLTVNPIGTNFSGVSVSLVNSLGQESSIKLSNLEASDKLLMTGQTANTRADGGTGLYSTTATIDVNSVEDPRLHISVDKSAVKAAWTDLKAVYNEQSLSPVQGSTLNKIANAIHSVVSGISTERLAIKTTYRDSIKDVNGEWVTTEKSIVSPYDLSGVMVKPLGFESLPEQYRDSIRAFNKVKKAIKKLNTRIAKKIIRTINKEADLNNIDQQIDDLRIKIKKVKPIPEDMKIIKQVVDIDTTVTVKVPVDYTTTVSIDTVLALNVPVEVEFDAVVPKNFSFDESTHKVTVTEWGDLDKTVNVVTNINFVYSRDVRFQKELETDVRFWIQKEFSFDMSDMVDNVNNALDVVTSVDGLCNSVQKIINNIYKYEDKLLAGKYLNRIYKFIDKASAYTAKGIYKMFQPVLLVNSDKGFGFAGIRGVPAEVTGKVEVIPTTYSNGLVAPVYKKYISVNGANGKVLDEGQLTLDITSDLNPGVNTVEYYAIDYYGNEWNEQYVIIKQ